MNLKYFFSRLRLVAAAGALCASNSFATSLITTAATGTPTDGYQASCYEFSDGDVARGTIIFKEGFCVPSCGDILYDADGQVFGDIIFGDYNSTLTLGTDLRLGSDGNFYGEGTIKGYGRSILLGGDTVLTSSLNIMSDTTIDGCGHRLDLRQGSFILSAESLSLKNMDLILSDTNCSGTSFIADAEGVNLALENVHIYLHGHARIFSYDSLNSSAGTLTIKGLVHVDGLGKTLSLNSSDTSNSYNSIVFIDENSTLSIGNGVTLDISDLYAPADQKIYLADDTSSIILDGGTLRWDIGDLGAYQALQLERGNLFLSDKATISNTYYGEPNADVACGLILGDGTAENDVNVRVLSGAYVALNGAMEYLHS